MRKKLINFILEYFMDTLGKEFTPIMEKATKDIKELIESYGQLEINS